jgi:hypothetical protein
VDDHQPTLAQALATIEDYLRRYMVMSDHQFAAVTLWAAHTYPIGDLWTTPYLHITSGEYGSGKTRLLFDVLGSLVRDPFNVVDVSPASLFRIVDATNPTALVDEIDALFGDKHLSEKGEAIRSMLNAGYRRRGSDVTRWDVTARQRETFNVFCPKALAGVGDLPRSLATRCIRIRLKKRLRSERVTSWVDYENRSHTEAAPMRLALVELEPLLTQAMRAGRPDMPEGIDDRDADIWAPLFAIADAAGNEWPTRARAAAVALLSDAADADDTIGLRLVADVRTVTGEANAQEHITTQTLLDGLHKLEESRWADFFGKPLNAHRLGRMLGRYDCKSRDVRTPEGTRKGYLMRDLTDAFDRYLGANPESKRDKRDNPDGYGENGDFAKRDPDALSRFADTPETGMVERMSRLSRFQDGDAPTRALFDRLAAALNLLTANGQMTLDDATAAWANAELLEPAELELVVADLEDGGA